MLGCSGVSHHMQTGIKYRRLAALIPIQLLANTSGKAAEAGPSAWAPEPMQETQKKLCIPGFGPAQYWPFQPTGE